MSNEVTVDNMCRLKNREHLLSNFAGELELLENMKDPPGLHFIGFEWLDKDGEVLRTMSLSQTAIYLAGDLYWDEEGDFSDTFMLRRSKD